MEGERGKGGRGKGEKGEGAVMLRMLSVVCKKDRIMEIMRLHMVLLRMVSAVGGKKGKQIL